MISTEELMSNINISLAYDTPLKLDCYHKSINIKQAFIIYFYVINWDLQLEFDQTHNGQIICNEDDDECHIPFLWDYTWRHPCDGYIFLVMLMYPVSYFYIYKKDVNYRIRIHVCIKSLHAIYKYAIKFGMFDDNVWNILQDGVNCYYYYIDDCWIDEKECSDEYNKPAKEAKKKFETGGLNDYGWNYFGVNI